MLIYLTMILDIVVKAFGSDGAVMLVTSGDSRFMVMGRTF